MMREGMDHVWRPFGDCLTRSRSAAVPAGVARFCGRAARMRNKGFGCHETLRQRLSKTVSCKEVKSAPCEMAHAELQGEEWPAELLGASDARHCMLANDWDARAARDTSNVHAMLMFSAPRAHGGDDAGVVAYAPPASPPGCWPASVSRTSTSEASGSQSASGFYVATCAPTNANEVRRVRSPEHGSVGQVCSRSHQTFMNTTRKCTGTYDPRVRHKRCNGGPLPPAV